MTEMRLASERVVANSIADSIARISASKDEAAGHHPYASCHSSLPGVVAVKAYAALFFFFLNERDVFAIYYKHTGML